jgi:hypothetical protein
LVITRGEPRWSLVAYCVPLELDSPGFNCDQRSATIHVFFLETTGCAIEFRDEISSNAIDEARVLADKVPDALTFSVIHGCRRRIDFNDSVFRICELCRSSKKS